MLHWSRHMRSRSATNVKLGFRKGASGTKMRHVPIGKMSPGIEVKNKKKMLDVVLVWFFFFKGRGNKIRTLQNKGGLGHLVELTVWNLRRGAIILNQHNCARRSPRQGAFSFPPRFVVNFEPLCTGLPLLRSRLFSQDASQTLFASTCTIQPRNPLKRNHLVVRWRLGFYARTWKLYARERSLLFACYRQQINTTLNTNAHTLYTNTWCQDLEKSSCGSFPQCFFGSVASIDKIDR